MKDRSAVAIRLIHPEDEPMMVKFHETLSMNSVYSRYFYYMKSLWHPVCHQPQVLRLHGLFYQCSGQYKWTGLRDFMIKTKVPFAAKWTFNAHFHNFHAAKGEEKNLGNELDVILNYNYNSVASFIFGLAFFIPGDLTEQRFANGDLGVWSFTTLLVRF